MSKKFWKLTNGVDSSGSVLNLEGPISQDTWWGDEVTPQAFRDELKQVTGNELTVIINSLGGDVWAGVSIYDALKALEKNVTVKVSGVAASIASVIAMAGDKIVMTPGSTMMIHRASSIAMGNAEDFNKVIEMLETAEEGIINIYSDRTGQSVDEIKNMMDNETWMSAEKAVELGFADEVLTSKVEQSDVLQNQFSGNFAFSMKATKESLDSFVKKATNQEDSEVLPEDPKVDPEVTPEVDTEVEDNPETTPEVKDPESTDTVEVDPEELNPTEKENTEMNEDQKIIAQSQVVTPENQAKVEQVKPTNYLETPQALEDFAKVLADNAGRTPTEVKDAWKNRTVQMGISNPEVLLPPAVIQVIEDAFKEGGEIWNAVNKTGLDVFTWARDTEEDEDARARGYNRSVEDEKAEEVITLTTRTIRPQFIYKYLTLPREVVKQQRSTGALLRYVMGELPRRIVREVERAIVTGDGRTDATAYKISSFVSLKADAADGATAFAQTYTPTAGMNNYEAVLRGMALVKAEGSRMLVAKSTFLTDTLLQTNANGGYLFAPGTNLGTALNIGSVVTPDWMDADTNDAYIFVPEQYRTVGDNTIEAFTNFALKTNTNEYLQEIYAGGGLTAMNSAVAIAPAGSV